MGLDKIIADTRNYILKEKIKLYEWVIFSLPDGLWVYAFTSSLSIYWQSRYTFWILVPVVISILLEVAQAFNFIKGTFDVVDVIFSVSAFLLTFLILNPNYKQNE